MHRNSLPHLDPFLRLIEGDDGGEGGAPPETGKTGDGEGGSGDGGSGEGGGTGGSGDGDKPGSGGTGGSGDDDKGGKSGEGKSGDDKGGAGSKTYDERYVEKLRDENAKARRKADEREAALVKGLRKLLGEDADQEETDPAKLAASAVQERDAARGQLAAQVRENAVLRATGTLGVNADRLLDSRGFERALSELDPADDKFAGKVKALIEKAAEKDPTLRVNAEPAKPQGGARMGGERDGGADRSAKGEVEKALAERAKRRGSD